MALVEGNIVMPASFLISGTSGSAAIGSGMPIFQGLEEKLPLKLLKSTGFSCGITVLCYEPDRK